MTPNSVYVKCKTLAKFWSRLLLLAKEQATKITMEELKRYQKITAVDTE